MNLLFFFRVQIWMMFPSQAVVSFFDFLIRCRSRNTENFVVISKFQSHGWLPLDSQCPQLFFQLIGIQKVKDVHLGSSSCHKVESTIINQQRLRWSSLRNLQSQLIDCFFWLSHTQVARREKNGEIFLQFKLANPVFV